MRNETGDFVYFCGGLFLRIAYLVSCDLSIPSGVTKKIFDQRDSWVEQGEKVCIFSTSYKNYNKPGIVQITYKTRLLQWFYFKPQELLKKIYSFKPDIIYLRYEPYKGYIGMLAKKYIVITEINSDDIKEYAGILKATFLRWCAKPGNKYSLRLLAKAGFIYLYNIATRGMVLSGSKACIFPTHEVSRSFGYLKNKKTIVIPNSIRLSKEQIVSRKIREDFDDILFIASNGSQPWQGIDLLENIAMRLGPKTRINIVGVNGKSHDNIVYYGFLEAKEYRKIASSCSVAISTIALFRNNMHEACPLKTREYLSMGLPIICGYRDTAFRGRAPEWVLQLPNNSLWIKQDKYLRKMKDFILKYRYFVVAHEKSAPYIDSSILETKRLEFMRSVLNSEE